MRYTARLLLAIVALASVLNLLWFCMLGGAIEPPASVLILKLPRSGSSWFTELLNNDPRTFISKEIIQSGDKALYTEQEKARHLAKALSRPTDKLSSARDFLPSGRFLEDYLTHKTWKWSTVLRAVGFTLNTEHCPGVLWSHVVDASAILRTKFIIFVRSNMVKTAVSALRGEELKRTCGLANIKQGRSDCVLPATQSITVAELLKRAIYWQDRYDAFYRRIAEDDTLSRMHFMQVAYEELQANTPAMMQRVHQFIRGNSPESALPSPYVPGLSVWVKRSPDDLSQLLTNFADINAQLSHHSCEEFKKQLNDINFTVFGASDGFHGHAAANFRRCLASLS